MQILKSIDELYAEVRDYDLVITNDAALETALNARVDTVRMGTFAVTPRHLARDLSHGILGRGEMSDLELVAAVAEETQLDFKYVYSEILNFREIRRYTANVRDHLTTNRSRRVFDSYCSLPTREKAMNDFDPFENPCEFLEGKRVAVIAPELFDDLDKHFNPPDHDVIDIFREGSEGSYEIPEFRRIGNDRQIAEHAADLIDPEHPDDFAIVMNATAPIADAVRAALYRRSLPFVNSLTVRDLSLIRDYISFLSFAMDFETVRVGQVKDLFAGMREYFKSGREGYLLSKIDEEDDMRAGDHRLRDIMREAFYDGLTFGDVIDRVFKPQDKSRVSTVIQSLRLEDQTVTPKRLSELRYAVDNVKELKHNEEIPAYEMTGVLLADCKNSVYVDKPVVIYLGLEQDWNIPVVNRRYIDSEWEAEVNAMRFSALLQQGQRRVYLINTTKNGKPAKPCLMFNQILADRKIEGFDSIAPVVSGRWFQEPEEIERRKGEVILDGAGRFDRPFSKSSFDAYYSCPRCYMFRSLLPSDEKKSNEFGTLIHSFAELYACHRDVVERMGLDTFVDLISDRYSGLSSPTMEEVDYDAVRRAMLNITRYLDMRGVTAPLDSRNSSKPHPNRFMEVLGVEESSTVCETDYRSTVHPIHGEFDLYWQDVITDYKTGKAKDGKDIGKEMTWESGAQYPEFQPLIYLAIASELEGFGDRFEMFYAMDNDVVSSEPGFDIRDNVRTVSVRPGNINRCMSESTALREEVRRKLKESMKDHADAVVDAVAETARGGPEGWRSDQAVVNAVVERAGLSGKSASKDAEVAIGYLADCIVGGMVVTRRSVEIPREMLDGFLESVDRMHAEAVEASTGYLPAKPRIDCRDCDYFEACTRQVLTVEEDGSDE